VIEHRQKNTEDEPRGVVFKHDLIGENGSRTGSSMGHLKDSKRIRLKGYTTKIRLGPTTMRICYQNRNIFENIFLSLK
jgi:hypothetical protein